jgi:hypothetical protein
VSSFLLRCVHITVVQLFTLRGFVKGTAGPRWRVEDTNVDSGVV